MWLNQQKEQWNFTHLNWICLAEPKQQTNYKLWLEKGYHGELSYMKNSYHDRSHPHNRWPWAKSIIVATQSYLPHPQPFLQKDQFSGIKIARYAQGQDYHFWFLHKLKQLEAELKLIYPSIQIQASTDSAPLLEKDYAQQAGLGWIGKNTCLINKKEGSFFIIGELLLSEEIPLSKEIPLNEIMPSPDLCGQCNLCQVACPTGALDTPYVMNATQCLSYWNIESQAIPPQEISQKMGSRFFGCDICQEVCPWNKKKLKAFESSDATTHPAPTEHTPTYHLKNLEKEELYFFLTASNSQILERLGQSPLLRARPFGLRRNAVIVATNQGYKELWPYIHAATKKYPKLLSLLPWVMSRFEIANPDSFE